jgi:hypothetical protein
MLLCKEAKIMKVMFGILCVSLMALPLLACDQPGKGYTMKNEPSGEYYDWKKTGKPERPWLLPYHQTLVTKIVLCVKNINAQPGKISAQKKKVYMTFAEALEVIRTLDNITIGIPKITYLVGWQFDGHDSKYPSWAEVNKDLKRPEDKTAIESLRWLIREARKYNTTVSLHINMFDAYEDSPLWDLYDKHDIFAKDKDGNIIFGEIHGGQRSAQISYTQEWKLGFAQKRIDDLIAMFPELKTGKTIHIDALHSVRPLGQKEPISPLLGYTMQQEAATLRKIYRYWQQLGFDATAEGAGHLRPDAFVGLQPMSWWDYPGGMPPELYCGSPLHAELPVMIDPENLPGLLDQFCLMVVPWYYHNNTTAVKGDQKMLDPDVGVKRHPRSGLFETVMAEYGNHVFMPALWREKTIVAYSRTGYANRTWQLPPDWKDVRKVTISRITHDGLKPMGEASVTNGKLTLGVKARQALMISPSN